MSLFQRLKTILFGKPIKSKFAQHQRLVIFLALPVFAADALSSTAYATEEILIVLSRGGTEKLAFLFPVSLALVGLLWTVVSSYRHTIHAYPTSGGAYKVAGENLGSWAGQTAAAALLIGYVLTVAVSISAGASAVIAMLPQTQPYAVIMASLATVFVAMMNLRGTRESGLFFSVPTYGFIAFVGLLVFTAIFRAVFQGAEPIQPTGVPEPAQQLQGAALVLFIFKAFAAGCTALTGTEAIASGVQAFRAPEPVNATKTLVLMAMVLSVLFLGVSWGASYYGITPMDYSEPGYKTVLAQMGEALFGAGTFWFYATQAATALILVLAANTAFVDFPRLSMFVAADGHLPRQLTSLGDRLVFTNGILTLTALAILLIVGFSADPHALIPMYAIGVFLSFTLSQSGMVAKWVRSGKKDWHMFVSLFGAIVTGIVTVVLLITRWKEGAWITVVAISGVLAFFWGISRHYAWARHKLDVQPDDKPLERQSIVLLLVPRVHKGIVEAIGYARGLTDDVRALHVTLSQESAQRVKKQWDAFGIDMPLVILESPYRSLVNPIVEYVDETLAESPDRTVTVIVPQAILKYPWQQLLHSDVAFYLKNALRGRRRVVITNVRYYIE